MGADNPPGPDGTPGGTAAANRGFDPNDTSGNAFDTSGETVTMKVIVSGYSEGAHLEFQHLSTPEGGAAAPPSVTILHRMEIEKDGTYDVTVPAKLELPVYVIATNMRVQDSLGGGGPIELKGSDVSVTVKNGDVPDWLPKFEELPEDGEKLPPPGE